MGARLNRIDPKDFVATPVVFVDSRGVEFTKMPGRSRKVPAKLRKYLYELDRTVRETKMEIRKVLADCGVSDANWQSSLARIRRERGR
jgi:hypothetical protein